MKRILYPLVVLVVVLFFHFTTNAQLYPTNDVFQGSILCGEKVIHVTKIPPHLQTIPLVNKEITTDSIYHRIAIRYYFVDRVIVAGRLIDDSVKTDTSVLNPYIRYNNKYVVPGPEWAINNKFYLNGDSAAVDMLQYGSPFLPCFDDSYNCDQLSVYRHQLREICPSFYTKLTKSYALKDDSIVAIFTDTIIPIIYWCLAVGFMPHVDTLTIPLSTLTPSVYTVLYKEVKKEKVECLVAPCPDSTIKIGVVGKANLSDCVPNGIENTTHSNSANLLYPNPASEKLYWKGAEGDVTLINTLGVSYTLTGTGEYSLKGLPTGVYTAMYRVNGVEHHQKLVVY